MISKAKLTKSSTMVLTRFVLVDDPMLKDYVTEPWHSCFAKLSKHLIPKSHAVSRCFFHRFVTLLPVQYPRVKTGLVADTTGLRMAKTQEELDKEAAMGNATPERALLMTRPAFGR